MKNPQKIKDLFNTIAKRYDLTNEIISCFQHKKVKKQSLELLNLSENDKVADLCSGTGDIVYFLKKKYPKLDIVGVDFSENMLQIAKDKNKSTDFILADCTDLPFEDNSFDVVTISFGLRNIEDYKKAISEIKRILKPNGQLFYLDFSCDNNFSDKMFNFVIPTLVKFFYKDNIPYKYLVLSKKEFLNTKSRINLFEESGFSLKANKSYVLGVISSEIYINNK